MALLFVRLPPCSPFLRPPVSIHSSTLLPPPPSFFFGQAINPLLPPQIQIQIQTQIQIHMYSYTPPRLFLCSSVLFLTEQSILSHLSHLPLPICEFVLANLYVYILYIYLFIFAYLYIFILYICIRIFVYFYIVHLYLHICIFVYRIFLYLPSFFSLSNQSSPTSPPPASVRFNII